MLELFLDYAQVEFLNLQQEEFCLAKILKIF